MSRRWPTLLAALLLGAALGVAGSRGKGPSSSRVSLPAADAPAAAESGPPSPARAPAKSDRGRDGKASSSSAAYAAAWELLKDGRLPRSERLALQRALLKEWALVDVPAAIRAVAADQTTEDDDPFMENFSDCLNPAIGARPELAWDIIQTRELGIGTSWLRDVWIQAVGRRDPVLLVGKLSQLPKESRYKAMRAAVVGSHHRDMAGIGGEQVLATLLALLGTPDGNAARHALIDGLSASVRCQDLRADVLRQQDSSVRAVYLDAYAQSLQELDVKQRVAELDALPAPFRAEVEQARKVRGDE